MSFLDLTEARPEARNPRNWITDTIVVLGILAFGYFALMIDATTLPWAAQAMLTLP